jgi:hypothetical protein
MILLSRISQSDLNGIIAMLLAAVLAQVRVVSIQEASAENGIKHV